MITNVFISTDRQAVAYEVDNGDGGIFIQQVGYEHVDEVEILEGDWIALGTTGREH